MIKKLVYSLPMLFLAFGFLIISVLRTAAVKYEFNGAVESSADINDIEIPYNLAYPGKILPDHPLWPLKALRDKICLSILTNHEKKAEVTLLFADKRIQMSQTFFEKGESEIAYATLIRAERYLMEASELEKSSRKKGINTSEFARVMTYASLKHIEMLKTLQNIAPEDAKPKIIELEKIPTETYNESMHALHEKGLVAPENPF